MPENFIKYHKIYNDVLNCDSNRIETNNFVTVLKTVVIELQSSFVTPFRIYTYRAFVMYTQNYDTIVLQFGKLM